MKTQLYKMRIEYEGFEKIVWRTVQVSSNYSLAKLGYLVLATFDTLAYHLFYIEYEGKQYELMLDDFDELEPTLNPVLLRLSDMQLTTGSKMKVMYDYGCEQIFNITMEEIIEMPVGTSAMYPRIIDGAGKGILDDVPEDEFEEIVKEIDKTGISTHIYLSPSGSEELWDYRDFDIDRMNKRLKKSIEIIQQVFEN